MTGALRDRLLDPVSITPRLLQRAPDGSDGFFALTRPAAALGHVGPATAALPAQRRHCRFTSSTALIGRKIFGDADGERPRLIDSDQRGNRRNRGAVSCRRSPAQPLGSGLDHLARKSLPATCRGFGLRFRAAAHGQRLLRLRQFSLQLLRSSTSAATRAGPRQARLGVLAARAACCRDQQPLPRRLAGQRLIGERLMRPRFRK